VQHADESAEIFAQLEKRFGAERMTDLLDLLEDLIATDRT
jgi:hypothetical protein